MKPSEPQFDFGENWTNFSATALTPGRLQQARRDFTALTLGIPVQNSHFLDIGFGQGLSLLIAASKGAKAVGCDINPKCAEALRANLRHFPEISEQPALVIGSILDPRTVATLRSFVPPSGTFGIVHSWGVLHHTGDLATSIRNAANLVAPGGHLILAIYNRHWSSPFWLMVKWIYVRSPHWLQRALVLTSCPIIYLAKWLVTLRNPLKQERGMDFYYNVIDWVGGYPYEYASVDQVVDLLRAHHLAVQSIKNARVPTGCNEFVFRKEA
jgi:2-polyprenyl-3-methyl-5-hydroxy-6-metoxy-1,4-benzoquinol methylase